MALADEIKKHAVEALKIEAQSIENLISFIDDDFTNAVELILNSKGRVVITGIGKSAIVAQKIVATLNSTGTPSIFMHAADAIHGDLGNIQQDDVVICISKSGNTPEIKVLVPLVKSFNNKLIAITGNTESVLGKQADYILNTYVETEACPNNLAPTSSTTAQMAMGDALAVCLLNQRGFTSKDFAKYHPGGSLGKKLYLRVADVFINNAKPQVSANQKLSEVIIEISSKRLGITAVVENETLLGVVTDGDLRRMLEKNQDITTLTAKDIMSASPKTIKPDTLAIEALHIMENNNITQLLVAENNIYLGVIHLHDLLKEGII
ncbi:KpsF/GutQ family sugar-phosphate isomerase [Vicingus serpentipes]|uniref:KpsF/GutQ family sugar-phosphate isomerase n=1 Tax=Vicingus serpentipes TaxID=1926625 RepID=A0A5C6RQJ7_9FLAO|nr:KpsF/GutQ family sugar-phosphate isomerase [Vicingus serpentipes]TXB64269.1 KpsF/GutQ family sugar-phosphate isomerase [Vicingus serpentipes]